MDSLLIQTLLQLQIPQKKIVVHLNLYLCLRLLAMPPLHLFGEYESLTQQHQEQFAPALTQLQASVDQMLHQLRRQEQSLVEAQAQQLAQIHAQLATDARCLLRVSRILCKAMTRTEGSDREIQWQNALKRLSNPG